MKIQVKQTEGLQIPKVATSASAGYDVVTITEPEIVGEMTEANAWKHIDYIQYRTGLFTSPQSNEYHHNYHTLIFPRSSVRRYNLILANCIGLVDNDYRGEIILCFKYLWQPEDLEIYTAPTRILGKINMDKIYKINDKIGQLVAEVTNPIEWMVVAELDQTVRGEDGFGSSDILKIAPKKDSGNVTPGLTITERYLKTGGISIKERYSNEVKKRKET